MRARRSVLALLSLIACLAVAACGDSDNDSEGSASVGDATVGASPEDAEGVPVDGPPDPALTVKEVAEQMDLPDAVADDEGFKQTLDILIAASHKYFSESLDSADVEYHLPDELIAYDGAAGDQGPDCGGQPAGAENAAYCRNPAEDGSNGIITWDETGLLLPLYNQLGDGSTAFIIGHEFAHLAQDRLGLIQQFPLTVEKELNADCLTGALYGDFGDAGVQYTKADIQSLFDGISIVGDQPGTPWQDEHAHGNAEERQTAFFDGFDRGFEYCLDSYGPGFSGG